MIDNFVNVFGQVMVLFILMVIGVVCGRTNIIDENSESNIAEITLYISTPCVIISAFQTEFNQERMHGLVVTLIVSAVIYAFGILLASITIQDIMQGRRSVMRFGAVFGNCGFMGLPLAQTMFGDEGTFYAAAIIALFNLLIWTYGYLLMASGAAKALPIKKLILNPGIIALGIGLLLFVTSKRLPTSLYSALKHTGNINTPLGMFLVGSRLSRENFKNVFKLGKGWLCTAERLVIIPIVTVFALYFAGITCKAAFVSIIAGCAPAASTTAMFAVLFHHDESFAAKIVSAQTILSAITMPIVIGVAQNILL